MSIPKYLSGKGKVIDNDEPVEGLKGKFVSELKDFSVPLNAADLKEQIIRKAKVNREWARTHLEVII